MKRLLVIMLLLVAIGIVSADVIKIRTDLRLTAGDITLEGYDNYDWFGIYIPVTVNYNSTTKELTVYDNWTYRVRINGFTLIEGYPAEISESGIDMGYYDYYVIEKYFDIVPGDPGTPITQ